ncbi:WAS/WASL-interacting protein family member 3-like [Rosa chinensis]|uniref:WAS/WASL-interacting protein family member 3-like n=1 Tax=Rosa chinensis TaxID=74649 RepID=UPI001AD93530|nr:WAS/WASL-interacting protein family member 3-like [Rosa chinensis]
MRAMDSRVLVLMSMLVLTLARGYPYGLEYAVFDDEFQNNVNNQFQFDDDIPTTPFPKSPPPSPLIISPSASSPSPMTSPPIPSSSPHPHPPPQNRTPADVQNDRVVSCNVVKNVLMHVHPPKAFFLLLLPLLYYTLLASPAVFLIALGPLSFRRHPLSPLLRSLMVALVTVPPPLLPNSSPLSLMNDHIALMFKTTCVSALGSAFTRRCIIN